MIAAVLVFLLLTTALADGPPGPAQEREELRRHPQKPDYSDKPLSIRKWFRDQKSPKTGQVCCDEADGGQAQEEIRNGRYWVSFCIVGDSKAGTCARSSGWIEVPDDVIIRGPNLAGHPVVWSYFENGVAKIRCFAPGAGI